MINTKQFLKNVGEYIKSPLGSYLIVPVALIFISFIVPEVDVITPRILFGLSIGLISISLPLQFHAYNCYEKTLKCYENSNSLHEQSKKFMIDVLRMYKDSKSKESKIFIHIVNKYHDEFVETLKTLADGYINVGRGHLYTGNLVLSGGDSINLAKRKVLAVETGQDPNKWKTNEKFITYISVNIEVASRDNMLFERIWIIQRGSEKEYYDLWKQHHDGNISTYFVYEESLDEIYLKYVDFVIIDDEIVYSANVTSNNRGEKVYNGGLISQRPADINNHQEYYKKLKNAAQNFK